MLKKTYTILAVALTATVTACGGVAEPEPDASEGQLSAGQAEPEPEPEPACDAEALNEELSLTLLDEAVANHAHFRCLCDDEGYPLVGNINGKVIATASQFCATLKEKDLL